jgi:hypothetical protein
MSHVARCIDREQASRRAGENYATPRSGLNAVERECCPHR